MKNLKDKYKKSYRDKFPYFLLFWLSSVPLIVFFDWPFARDTAVYVDGFGSFLRGENPYESGIFRAGLVGSSLLYALANFVPQHLESLFFLALNVLGVRLFVSHFLSDAPSKARFFVSVLVLWSSTSREGLNTIQIMGILLALQVFMMRALSLDDSAPATKFEKCIGILSAAIALDLKPHMVLPLFMILILRGKKLSFLVYTIILLVTGHAITDYVSGRTLTLDWIRLVLGLANTSITENKADFVNVWALIFHFVEFGWFNSVLPFLLIIAIMFYVILKEKLSYINCVYVGLALPLLSSYSHLYDYLGIVALTLAYISKSKSADYLLILIPFLTVSQNWKEIPAGLLVLMLLSLCLISTALPISSGAIQQAGKRSAQGILLYLLIHIVQDFLTYSGFSEAALSATFTLILLTLFFFKTSSRH